MKARLTLISAILILAVTVTNGQSKTTLGLRGGVNFYNITGKNLNGDKLDNKLKTGFNLGLNAEIPIGIDFYVQPGIIYSSKGASKINGSSKASISYIEIPVNLLYKPELGSGKLLLGFGPYVAFGVGGRYEFGNGNGDRTIKFKNKITPAQALAIDNFYYKGLDAGANLLFGYEWLNRFSVQLNAGLGLVDITPKVEGASTGKTKQNNTGFGVSFGYRFGR
jgi:hypothetical protein